METEKGKIFNWLDELRDKHKEHRAKAGLRPCTGCMELIDKIRASVEKLEE